MFYFGFLEQIVDFQHFNNLKKCRKRPESLRMWKKVRTFAPDIEMLLPFVSEGHL
jgi:hypothetical protein